MFLKIILKSKYEHKIKLTIEKNVVYSIVYKKTYTGYRIPDIKLKLCLRVLK